MHSVMSQILNGSSVGGSCSVVKKSLSVLYDMVRVWYGMVWYGMPWYGMPWYGMVYYGMVWHGMVNYTYVCHILRYTALEYVPSFHKQCCP